MSWFKKDLGRKDTDKKGSQGLWVKCNNCSEIIYKKEVERNLEVCPKCDYHFRIAAHSRMNIIMDKDTFVEMDADMTSKDPIGFRDMKTYKDRVKAATKSGVSKDAFIYGMGTINGKKAVVGIFDFTFMGGSMGSVVGEKITRLIEKATAEGCGAIVFSASGGARMQEGIFSLMQMAKTSAAIKRHKDKGLPYISVLTDPTTGGVTASFAMLGDVNIAEPKALIGFAGQRVIQETIRQKLPDGFQRAEYLLEHGMVDMIVERKDMKDKLAQLLGLFAN